MKVTVREYNAHDLAAMTGIWNEVVAAGNAFPQEEPLTPSAAADFFAQQSHCGVAECAAESEKSDDKKVLGLYILHPNNIGRCGHIANASYAVSSESRGMHIGEKLVLDCMEQARRLGFKILQFNAVVATNLPARHLYERIGFLPLGTIKGGFRCDDGSYADICPYYISL